MDSTSQTISRLQQQLTDMQRELESSRRRALYSDPESRTVSESQRSATTSISEVSNLSSGAATASVSSSILNSHRSISVSGDSVTSSHAARSSGRSTLHRATIEALQTRLRVTEQLNRSLQTELSIMSQKPHFQIPSKDTNISRNDDNVIAEKQEKKTIEHLRSLRSTDVAKSNKEDDYRNSALDVDQASKSKSTLTNGKNSSHSNSSSICSNLSSGRGSGRLFVDEANDNKGGSKSGVSQGNSSNSEHDKATGEGKGRHSNGNSDGTYSVLESPPNSARSNNAWMDTYLEEVRGLRASLEASAVENDRLRQRLEAQAAIADDRNSLRDLRRLKERLTSKKRRVAQLEKDLATERARATEAEREAKMLRSELASTRELLKSCKTELEICNADEKGTSRQDVIKETQRLRMQLERSIDSNRRLHSQMQEQLGQIRTHRSNAVSVHSDSPRTSVLVGRGMVTDVMSEAGSLPEEELNNSTRHLVHHQLTIRTRSASPEPIRVDSDFRLLHAISRLDDFELVRKEVQETLCLVHSVRSRIDDRLRHYKAETAQVSLDYSTLKELETEVKSIVYFLEEEDRLIGRFWVAELPPRDQHGHYYDPSSYAQLVEAQTEVERLQNSNRLLRQLLCRKDGRELPSVRKNELESERPA